MARSECDYQCHTTSSSLPPPHHAQESLLVPSIPPSIYSCSKFTPLITRHRPFTDSVADKTRPMAVRKIRNGCISSHNSNGDLTTSCIHLLLATPTCKTIRNGPGKPDGGDEERVSDKEWDLRTGEVSHLTSRLLKNAANTAYLCPSARNNALQTSSPFCLLIL